MPTDVDLARFRARQAWWLKVAREADPRKPTLSDVAQAAGLKEGSGSVASLWENNLSVSGPKQEQLYRLAAFYGLPVTLFSDPPETDEEHLATLRQLALAAIEIANEDLEQEAAVPTPPAADAPGPPRRKRSA